MKRILKIILYIFTFIFALFLFLPKEYLYNLLEKQLEKNSIIISNEKRDEKLFGLDILTIVYQNSDKTKIEEYINKKYKIISSQVENIDLYIRIKI